jgi:hypothetical protein
MYKSYYIHDDEERDGCRKVGFIYTSSDVDDCPRILYRILSLGKLQITYPVRNTTARITDDVSGSHCEYDYGSSLGFYSE